MWHGGREGGKGEQVEEWENKWKRKPCGDCVSKIWKKSVAIKWD